VHVLDVIFVLGIATAVISVLFFATRWTLPKVIFGVAVVAGLIVAATSRSIAQFQVQQRLESEPADTPIFVDGHQLQNSGEVLTELKRLGDLPAHHSHPTKIITVEVAGRPHLTLWLGRDSDDPREYWVFDPSHLITRNNEIGRIITPVFDGY
jgi:hypothetical protein